VDAFVTIDAGTGSGRCVAFDAAGRILAKTQAPLTYRMIVDPALPMIRGFDLDADAFWGALVGCVRRTLEALPSAAVLRGVIATSQREGCVFLDRDGGVLYAGPNLDARAALEGMEIVDAVPAARLHAITGHAPPYIFPVARHRWYRKHHDASRIASLFMLNDWIGYRLSGARVVEESNACESMLFDVTTRRWSDELLAALDVPPAILPPVCAAGTPIGAVTPAAAFETGLPAGLPVFAGGADTESALLGSGVLDVGMVGAVIGTTAPVQEVTARAVIDPAGNLWTSCHVVPGRWVLESNGGDTGGTFRWLLELLYGVADAEAHRRADVEAGSVPDDGRPIVSHLGPAIFNLSEMNPFQPAGLLFGFPLLHVDRPSRAEILRAFFENVAFAIRGNCEQIAAVSGRPLAALHVSGGMTQSPTLLALLAATLQVPLVVADVPESASLGSAILATVASGAHPDLPSAVAAMVSSRTVEPDRTRAGALADRYARWREVYGTLRGWTL
jgi:sugar (pentulose or hexulose) kinase